MRWNSKEPKLQQSLQPGFLGHREVVETGKGTWEVKFSSGKTGRVTTLVSQNAPSWGHRGLCKNQRWKTCWDSWFRWASCWVGDKNAEVMGIWNISMKTMKSAIKVESTFVDVRKRSIIFTSPISHKIPNLSPHASAWFFLYLGMCCAMPGKHSTLTSLLSLASCSKF